MDNGCDFRYGSGFRCNRLTLKGEACCEYHTRVLNKRMEPSQFYNVDKEWLKYRTKVRKESNSVE